MSEGMVVTEETPETMELAGAKPETTEVSGEKEFSRENFDAFLEVAAKKGIDPDKIFEMTDEDVAKFMEEEKTPTQETQPEPEGQPEAPSPQEKPSETPQPSPESVELANLKQLFGRQTQELGQLRATVSQVKPLLDKLNTDPEFLQHVVSFGQQKQQFQVAETPTYDPFNPDSVVEFIRKTTESGVTRVLTEREQRQREELMKRQEQELLTGYNTGLQTGIAELIGKGLPQDAVQTAVTNLIARVVKGDIAAPAILLANYDAAIKEAEARGRKTGEEEARKKVGDLANAPVRTASAAGRQTSSKPATNVTELDSIETPEAMNQYLDTLAVGSPEWHIAMKKAEKRKWTG